MLDNCKGPLTSCPFSPGPTAIHAQHRKGTPSVSSTFCHYSSHTPPGSSQPLQTGPLHLFHFVTLTPIFPSRLLIIQVSALKSSPSRGRPISPVLPLCPTTLFIFPSQLPALPGTMSRFSEPRSLPGARQPREPRRVGGVLLGGRRRRTRGLGDRSAFA